jgi:hypothetical protein
MQFGCIMLPDEPDHIAEGFDMNMDFEEPPEGGSGTWLDAATGRRMLRLWGLSLGMTLDLVAHCPGSETRLVTPRSRSGSKGSSPDRATLFGPRTPVTVVSSFDQHWFPDESTRGGNDSGSGSLGASNGHANGSSVSVATMPVCSPTKRQRTVTILDKRRRGVGPGVTAVFPRFSYPDVNFWIWVFGRRYRQIVQNWEDSVHGPDRAADRRTNWSGAALSTFYQAVRHALVVAIIIRGLATIGGVAGLTWWVLRHLGSAAQDL